MDAVMAMASQRAVVIFSNSSCCMCHAVEQLFIGQLGVNPAIHELDKDPKGKEIERALERMLQSSSPVPAVFIGGKLIGPTDRIMSLHLSGKLVPLLRAAGAIWL